MSKVTAECVVQAPDFDASSTRMATQTWHMAQADAEVWLAAADLAQERQLRRGQVLYRQGEVGHTLYFVRSGRVQVSMFQRDGSEFLLEVMGRWSLCGEGPALDGLPRFSTAVALEACDVLEFDSRRILAASVTHPSLLASLLRVVAIKQRVLGARIQYLALPSPEMRIGELLSRLADLYGEAVDTRWCITIPLTHEQVAAMTGTSRVTVTRALKRLRDEGIVAVAQRRFWILDRERLLQPPP